MSDIRDSIAEINEGAMFLDDEEFDAAILGYVERFGMAPVTLYDQEKVIEIMVAQGMTEDEASEFFEFNTIGAWCGEGTPAFAVLIQKE